MNKSITIDANATLRAHAAEARERSRDACQRARALISRIEKEQRERLERTREMIASNGAPGRGD